MTVMDPSKPQPAQPLVPDIVNNIPLQVQGRANLKPADEDDELDRIMRDVGKDIKEVVKKPDKHHGFFKHNKSAKREPKLVAQPIKHEAPAAPAPKPIATASQKPAVLPKPLKTSSPPVLAITVAILATGALIAAAYYAYK
jgi:hypothetical protein